MPKSPTRTLEQLGVRTCMDSYSDTSSGSISMRFCKTHKAAASKNISGDCCQTNNFGWNNDVNFEHGQLTKIDGNTMKNRKLDDGGEALGQCEGFEISGSEVFVTGMKIFILLMSKNDIFVNNMICSCFEDYMASQESIKKRLKLNLKITEHFSCNTLFSP